MEYCLDDQISGSMRLSSSSAQPLLSAPATWLLEQAFKGLAISVQPSIVAAGFSSEWREKGGGVLSLECSDNLVRAEG